MSSNPLRLDPLGVTFTRIALAKAIKNGGAEFAANRWGENSPAARIIKAAVSAGGSLSGTWGAELVPDYAAASVEFVGLVRKRSIIGRMNGLRRVPLRTRVLKQTSGASGKWMKEGAPIPLQALGFDAQTIEPLSLAAIVAATEELMFSRDPAAETLFRNDLIAALAEASDLAFIDPQNAGIADQKPAAVTHGITPQASTGNFKTDLDKMVAAFAGDLDQAVLVGRPEMWTQINSAAFPNIGARGGEVAGIPAIASKSLPLDAAGKYQFSLIDPTGITYGADDENAQVDASRSAPIQLDDAPASPPTASSVFTSLWQVNGVAIRAFLSENWEVSRVGAVSLVNGLAPTA